jgi:hypothetical protein
MDILWMTPRQAYLAGFLCLAGAAFRFDRFSPKKIQRDLANR